METIPQQEIEQKWRNLVAKTLEKSKENFSSLDRNIFSDQTIPAVSLGYATTGRQCLVPNLRNFLTIQNYNQLKKCAMEEWFQSKDVAFRFEQLRNLIELSDEQQIKNGNLFISQPVAFNLSAQEKDLLSQLAASAKYINLGWSPLSFGLTRGEMLKRPFTGWEDIFQQESLKKDNCCWFYLSSAPYQWAGAEPHVEIAILISLAYRVIKELNFAGIPLSFAKNKISFGLSMGTDILVESSKITALKLLWSRLCEVLGEESPAQSVDVFCLPSLRYFSGRDPWNNVMRLTLMTFSSLVGGAQGIKCIPYDILSDGQRDEAVRISTNIPLLLQQEGFVSSNANVLDGSPLFTNCIDQLCEHAWNFFQQIDKKGGLFEVARSGWLQSQIKSSAIQEEKSYRSEEKLLIGTTKYMSEEVPFYNQVKKNKRLQDIIDPKFLLQDENDYINVEPVLVQALAQPFEELRFKSDSYLEVHGKRPEILGVRTGGSLSEKKVKWLDEIASIGGVNIRWIKSEELNSVNTDYSLAMVLPSNIEDEEKLLTDLKSKGVDKVWYQGVSRESIEFDGYLFMGSDVYEFLNAIYQSLGGKYGSY